MSKLSKLKLLPKRRNRVAIPSPSLVKPSASIFQSPARLTYALIIVISLFIIAIASYILHTCECAALPTGFKTKLVMLCGFAFIQLVLVTIRMSPIALALCAITSSAFAIIAIDMIQELAIYQQSQKEKQCICARLPISVMQAASILLIIMFILFGSIILLALIALASILSMV